MATSRDSNGGTRNCLVGALPQTLRDAMRAVSWLTDSRQLVISWLGIVVTCGSANHLTLFYLWGSFLVGRLAWYGLTYFPASPSSTTNPASQLYAASTQRGLLPQPIAIDYEYPSRSYLQCPVDDEHLRLQVFERCSP